jgi:hypothetical protein
MPEAQPLPFFEPTALGYLDEVDAPAWIPASSDRVVTEPLPIPLPLVIEDRPDHDHLARALPVRGAGYR